MKVIGSLSFQAWLAGQKSLFPDSDDYENMEAWYHMPEKEKAAWEASVNKIIELIQKNSE